MSFGWLGAGSLLPRFLATGPEPSEEERNIYPVFQIRATATGLDGEPVEIVLIDQFEGGTAPRRIRATLGYFRQVFVVDEDGERVQYLKDNLVGDHPHGRTS